MMTHNLHRSISSFSSVTGSEDNKETVKDLQEILHFLNDYGPNLEPDSDILQQFEAVVSEVLLRNQDAELIKILEDCGWNGCRFKESDESPLNVDYCKQALCNFYLKASNSKSKMSTRTSLKRSVSNSQFDNKSNQIAEQLFSLCPDLLVDALALDPSSEQDKQPFSVHFWGACVLADMSGFSKFSGEMCAKGVEGLDELRATTSGFLGDLVNTVYKFKGDVIAFAGDALICVFPGCKPYLTSNPLIEPCDFSADCCMRALLCACELSTKTTKSNANAFLGTEQITLSTHVGVSYGEMSLSMLGGHNGQWVYILAGSCVNDLATCVPDAGPQEVACTRLCLRKVEPFDNNKLLFKSKLFTGSGNVKIKVESIEESDGDRVKAIEDIVSSSSFLINSFFIKSTGYRRRGLDRVQSSKSIMKSLWKFAPSTVRHALHSEATDILGELRNVTTMFLSLDSYSREKEGKDPMKLQSFLVMAQRRLDETGGFLRQFLVDDKGCVLIAMWGVPAFSYTNNGTRGLLCAASIFMDSKFASYAVSIGVATGMVFCGCVGAKSRYDYVGIGTDVNIAARLMSKAHGKVLIDPTTYRSLNKSARQCLVPHDVLQLKGLKEPMQPFRFNYESYHSLPSLTEPDERLCSNLMLRKSVLEALSRQIDGIIISPLLEFEEALQKEETINNMRSIALPSPSRAPSALITQQRQPSVMFLLGAAGAGKAAACKYFRQAAHQRNISCIIIQAQPSHRNIPFGVVRDLFFALIGRKSYSTGKFGRTLLQMVIENAFAAMDGDPSEGESILKCCERLETILGLQWVESHEMDSIAISPDAQPPFAQQENPLVDESSQYRASLALRERLDLPGLNERVDTLKAVENRIYSSSADLSSKKKINFSPKIPSSAPVPRAPRVNAVSLWASDFPSEMSPMREQSEISQLSDVSAEKLLLDSAKADSDDLEVGIAMRETSGDAVDDVPTGKSSSYFLAAPMFSPRDPHYSLSKQACPAAATVASLATSPHEERRLLRQSSRKDSFFRASIESSKLASTQAPFVSKRSIDKIPVSSSSTTLRKADGNSQYRMLVRSDSHLGETDAIDDIKSEESQNWQAVSNSTQWASDRSQKFKRKAPGFSTSQMALVSSSSPSKQEETKEDPSSPRDLDESFSLQRSSDTQQRVDGRRREETVLFVVLLFLLKDSPKAVVIENGHHCDECSWQMIDKVMESADLDVALLVTIILRNYLSESDKEMNDTCLSSDANVFTGSSDGADKFPPNPPGDGSDKDNAVKMSPRSAATKGKIAQIKMCLANESKSHRRTASKDLQTAVNSASSESGETTLPQSLSPSSGFRFSIRGLVPSYSTTSTLSNPISAVPSNDGVHIRSGFLKTKIAQKLQQDVVEAGLALLNKPYTEVIELGALNREEVREILKHTLQVDSFDDSLTDLVVNVSSGNPFWCRTIATFIKEQGLSEFTERSNTSNPTSTLEFLIVCRMDKLEERHRVVLRHASIIGQLFTQKLLHAILPFRAEKDWLNTVLGKLVSQGFLHCLEEYPEHKFSFQNPLIQSVVYGVNTRSDAATIHQRIAEFLEVTHNDNLRPYYSSLAYHYGQCLDQKEMAFKYGIKCADQSISQGAFIDGLELLKNSFQFATRRVELRLILELILIVKEDIESTIRSRFAPLVVTQIRVFTDANLKEYEKFRKIVSEKLREMEEKKAVAEEPVDRRQHLTWQPSYVKMKRQSHTEDSVSTAIQRGFGALFLKPSEQLDVDADTSNLLSDDNNSGRENSVPVVELTDNCFCLLS